VRRESLAGPRRESQRVAQLCKQRAGAATRSRGMSRRGWGQAPGGAAPPASLVAIQQEQQLAGPDTAASEPMPEPSPTTAAAAAATTTTTPEDEDLALALTLQAIEDEELLIAQQHFARQLQSAKQSGAEKIRVLPVNALSGEPDPGALPRPAVPLVAYTRSVEEAERQLAKSHGGLGLGLGLGIGSGAPHK